MHILLPRSRTVITGKRPKGKPAGTAEPILPPTFAYGVICESESKQQGDEQEGQRIAAKVLASGTQICYT